MDHVHTLGSSPYVFLFITPGAVSGIKANNGDASLDLAVEVENVEYMRILS